MTRVYGYVRISSTDQNEDRQLDAMESRAVPQKNIYVDVEEMITGDWDLTLFTCTLGGQTRVTVRCQLIEK